MSANIGHDLLLRIISRARDVTSVNYLRDTTGRGQMLEASLASGHTVASTSAGVENFGRLGSQSF